MLVNGAIRTSASFISSFVSECSNNYIHWISGEVDFVFI